MVDLAEDFDLNEMKQRHKREREELFARHKQERENAKPHSPIRAAKERLSLALKNLSDLNVEQKLDPEFGATPLSTLNVPPSLASVFEAEGMKTISDLFESGASLSLLRAPRIGRKTLQSLCQQLEALAPDEGSLVSIFRTFGFAYHDLRITPRAQHIEAMVERIKAWRSSH